MPRTKIQKRDPAVEMDHMGEPELKGEDPSEGVGGIGEVAGITPLSVESHIAGITYPAEKEDLIEHAKLMGAPDEVLDALDTIPDATYQGPSEVLLQFRDEL